MLGDHWDPTDPRDVAMIHRYARDHRPAFEAMGPESEAVAVEMMRLSAQAAREAKAGAVDPADIVDAGKLAVISGKLALDIRRTKQADDHHAEDLVVKQANAVSAAAQAGLVKKVYIGLDPGQI